MSTNTLETAYSNGAIIDASHINELTSSLLNQLVGRNSSGVPTAGKSLGTAALPWGPVHAASLVLGGLAVDTSQIVSLANRVISGASRTDSEQPDFLRAAGVAGGASLTVLGAATNILLSVNSIAATVSTDIVKTSLTLASAANNTALVNDTNMVNDLFAGEDDATIKEITIDTVGSEITDRIGQYIGLQTATGEIMYAFVKNATTLSNVFRGYFFDDTGVPIVRGNLSNNDTLTIMNLGWVFVEDNGTTVDVTYNQPVFSFESPSGPTTGDYWFDITNQTWKRYTGIQFDVINRTMIGVVALDDTDALASRAIDFTNSFRELNNVELEVFSTEIILSKNFENRVSVYGTEVIQDLNKLSFNMTTDLESGVGEAADTEFYLYVSTEGERIISTVKYWNRKDLKGQYHPYHSWRYVGSLYNDGGSNIERVSDLVVLNSYVRLETANGYGSGSTAIPRFNTVVDYNGTDLTYLDSATLGTEISINKKGKYTMSYSSGRNGASGAIGISLNSTQLTTGIQSINVGQQLAWSINSQSDINESVSWTGFLEKGDIVRPHAHLSALIAKSLFSISRVD